MGQMRFLLPQRDRLLPGAVDRAYLTGFDQFPSRSANSLERDTLLLDRAASDSAHLTIPWPIANYGDVALRTASLMERPRPYNLPVELARGTLSRLRERAAEVRMAGLALPAGFSDTLRTASQLFFRAATSQDDPCEAGKLAEQALALALPVMDRLVDDVSRQLLDLRHDSEPRFATLLGSRLAGPPLAAPQGERFLQAFNAASVSTSWRSIQVREQQWSWAETDQQLAWCRQFGLRVCAGPILELDSTALPEWLRLFDDDFAALLDRVCRFVQQVVERYRDSVHAWLAVARLGSHTAWDLSDEQKLRLAVGTIETIHRHDPRKPLVLTFAHPWAEYMAREDRPLSSLHFADALVRADLGVAGLGLELDLDYLDGSLPRDILQIESCFQQWSHLGLPLLALLAAPSSPDTDPRALRQPRRRGAATPDGYSPQTQEAYARRVVRLLLSRPAVQGLIWNETRDAVPHEFAHGGLFDAADRPKPVLDVLAGLRREHLV